MGVRSVVGRLPSVHKGRGESCRRPQIGEGVCWVVLWMQRGKEGVGGMVARGSVEAAKMAARAGR